MTLTLKPYLERFIDEQVNAGLFRSAEEVLEAGLARLMLDPMPEGSDREDFKKLLISLEQEERGELIDGRELHATIRARYVDRQP
jgi:Arc/MetJ-type ribon-helix-helix transcriptional regulator